MREKYFLHVSYCACVQVYDLLNRRKRLKVQENAKKQVGCAIEIHFTSFE